MVGVIGIVLGLAMGAFGLGMMIPPFQRGLQYTTNRMFPNAEPDPSQLIVMRWRRVIDEDAFKAGMRVWGFNPDRTEKLFQISQTLLTAREVIMAKWRGIIDEQEYRAQMKKLQFTNKTMDRLERVLEFRPGATDLIRFAVREAFRPEFVERFELDAEFPELIIPRAKEIGIREEDLKLYWRAHWELPSLIEATEMWHRLNPEWETEYPVTDDDLDLLLRARDVMRFWRPRLKKILYRLPTRVDIRRMFRDGHLTEGEVIQLYRQLGYDPTNARRMANLAKTFYKDEDRKLTRALILKAFKVGEINRDEAKELLMGLDYNPDDAELIVRLTEIEEADKELDEKIAVLALQFRRGVIDEVEFTDRLDALGISGARRDKIVLSVVEAKKRKQRLPTKADIEEFLKKGVITTEEAETFMREIGIRDKDIPLYFKAWGRS